MLRHGTLKELVGKTVLDRDQEQAVKAAVIAVHNAALHACDSLQVVHQKLCELGKVAPLNIYLKVVREQQISKLKCGG